MNKPELSYDGCGINSREHGRIFTAARHHKDNGGGFILDDKERERVGVLMASAPELLEALKEAVSFIGLKHGWNDQSYQTTDGRVIWFCADKARQAIAKAEGRT